VQRSYIIPPMAQSNKLAFESVVTSSETPRARTSGRED
jgi:hypothetical protein